MINGVSQVHIEHMLTWGCYLKSQTSNLLIVRDLGRRGWGVHIQTLNGGFAKLKSCRDGAVLVVGQQWDVVLITEQMSVLWTLSQ